MACPAAVGEVADADLAVVLSGFQPAVDEAVAWVESEFPDAPGDPAGTRQAGS